VIATRESFFKLPALFEAAFVSSGAFAMSGGLSGRHGGIAAHYTTNAAAPSVFACALAV
jgi:hypothetical protein